MEEEYDIPGETRDILTNMVDFEGKEIRGFHKTISEDIKDLLIETNPTLMLNNSPKLTMLLIVDIHSNDPCSSCKELLSNVTTWSSSNVGFNNQLRIMLLDASSGFDERRIWAKLKTSFNDVPLTLFFDGNNALVDIVQGVMSVNYLEMFWTASLVE